MQEKVITMSKDSSFGLHALHACEAFNVYHLYFCTFWNACSQERLLLIALPLEGGVSAKGSDFIWLLLSHPADVIWISTRLEPGTETMKCLLIKKGERVRGNVFLMTVRQMPVDCNCGRKSSFLRKKKKKKRDTELDFEFPWLNILNIKPWEFMTVSFCISQTSIAFSHK